MAHRILICDDAMFMRTMLGDMLREAGYEVVGEASDGVAAIEQYRALRPDVVMMDIVMPNIGGIDAVKAILAENPEARIVMCSAMGQQHFVLQAVQAGAREFVIKPFHPDRVLEAIERATS